jgi:hypothetical protein
MKSLHSKLSYIFLKAIYYEMLIKKVLFEDETFGIISQLSGENNY